MKISCPSCSAKYSIADEKVQNRLAKIRCRKCSTYIVIDGNMTPPSVYAADGGDSAEAPAEAIVSGTGTVFTVDFGEGDQRQMSVPQIVDAYHSGSVTAETYVWAEGYADWTPLGQVEEVVQALHRVSHPVDSNAAAAQSTAPAEDPFPRQPALPQARPSADLFGAIKSAGSEQELATSAAAASPFGAAAATASTGARNESSVLFSLSALTSGSTSSRPSVPAPSVSNNDDSGLIDLKALTEAAAAHAASAPVTSYAAPAMPSPIATAPLVSPLGPPLGTMPHQATRGSVPPSRKSNAGLFIIGGSIIVAVVAAAAVITLLGKDDPTPPPAVVAAPTPPPAPPAAPLPAASTTPSLPSAEEATAPKTGTDGDEAAAKSATTTPKKTTTAAKKPASSSSSSTPAPSSSSSSSSTSSSPAPAKKPASGGCGCKAGDLMCAMKCSAK